MQEGRAQCPPAQSQCGCSIVVSLWGGAGFTLLLMILSAMLPPDPYGGSQKSHPSAVLPPGLWLSVNPGVWVWVFSCILPVSVVGEAASSGGMGQCVCLDKRLWGLWTEH